MTNCLFLRQYLEEKSRKNSSICNNWCPTVPHPSSNSEALSNEGPSISTYSLNATVWMLQLTGGWSSATTAQPPSLLPLQFFSISIPIKRGETNWSEPIFEKVYETEKLKKEPFFTLCWQSGRWLAMICCWTRIFLTANKRIQQCDKQFRNRIKL